MNRVIFIISFFAAAISAQAQLGITAGLNSSKEASHYSDRKGILTWNVGLTYRMFPHKSVNILPELIYTIKGITNYPDYTGNVLCYRNRDQYIQLTVPVQKSFSLSDDDEWSGLSFQAGAGPFIGGLIKSVTTEETFSGDKTPYTNKIGTDVKSMDYGFRAFIGMAINNRIQTQIRYDHGLANINANGTKCNTRDLSFNFIYWFGGE